MTVAAFVASILLFRFVPQQFFPDSTRPELMVDMELAEGSSLKATERRPSAWKRCCASARASTTTSRTSAPVRRVSTCRSTSNCPRRTSRSSSCAPATRSARRRAHWLIDEVAPQFPRCNCA
jgi:multidrug efflux pump